MSYGKHMNDLTEICTQVWATNDVTAKKALLRRAVESFKYRAKKETILQSINQAVNAITLDHIASNLILNKTDKVVQPLPR